ncbi:MAG: tRNA (N6-isopentenyl adenosine(37)-C2)-methylthiotransferase MiaB [Candidatus Neomarinimicrobiota bacterium]|nr:tRNA (N6-isopentenyl adenosine(37)-C2)-methylthiotransferase MiaB [Candidatus Neomarinimicrobiota bacterium]
MNKTYHIHTYGCQMNVSDSELVESILIKKGYKAIIDPDNADVLFVNTCSIREHAEDKVHSLLGRYNVLKSKKPDMIIGVLGCMAQSLKHDILENKPYVDIVLGPDSYRKLPELLNRHKINKQSLVDTELSRYEVYDDLFPSRKKGINAWITIMRGCDKFCTFCIVPFTRGRERSRSIDGIVNEIKNAVKDGFTEVTLLGQNVNSYNFDGQKFHVLLENVARVPGLKRLRYTSPHPQDITIELLDIMARYDNICNSIHLPLQSGSDRILKRMNRTYTSDHFINIVRKIREILPNPGISTDIIVGFPGESEKDFSDTINVMEKVNFDSAFTFKYSPRNGTKASGYEDQINEDIKQKRLEQIISLQKSHTILRNQSYLGKIENVLIEKQSKRNIGKWAGRTDSNKWVIFDKDHASIKDIVPVLIMEARGITLHGKIINKAKAA